MMATFLTSARREETVDPIQLIKNDHREVERLFAAFERAHHGGDRREQGRIARDLVRALSVHAVVEEQLVYPLLREAGGAERVFDALEEHHAVKLTLAEIERASPSQPRFAAKMRVLENSVREHVAEEERELLPRLARLDGARLRELGEAVRTAKRAAPTRPHPAAPDTPPAGLLAGAVAAVFDRSRDALRGGAEMLRAVAARAVSRGARSARGAARQARRSGKEAVRGATQRGREVVEDVAERGFGFVDGAGQRGREAAREVRTRAAEAAREVRQRGRAATGRGRGGRRAGARQRGSSRPSA
jgi:hemerythrin superfamily protein